MASNPDLEAVVSYIKSHNILLDFQEFKFQVETHPDYPSLLAFSDAITFFKIPNVAVKFDKVDLENLPDSFVVLLTEEQKAPYLSFVVRKNEFYFHTKEKETKKISKIELQKIWGNIILLVEKSEEIHEVVNKKHSLSFILSVFSGILIIGVVLLFSQSILALIFTLTIIVGIYFSIQALKTELGIESKVSKSFCQIMGNADCEKVINSTKNTWSQKFKISDISIWFFCSQLFLLFVFSVLGNINYFYTYMLIALGLAFPLTIYSIYFQYKIEKKWCPLCLTIIILVYVQLILLLINRYEIALDLKSIILFIYGFLLIATAVYFIKPLLLEVKNLQEKNLKNLRFKRNFALFNNSLEKSEQQFFENQFIVLGNPKAKLKISIVTSPFCGYCAEAHDILHRILDKHRDSLSFNIRFNYDENMHEEENQFFYRIIEIYHERGDLAFSEALKFYFQNKNIDSWLSKYGQSVYNTENIKKELLKVANENKAKGLNFTPDIYVNQYRFPTQYEKNDLEYFITDLIDDK